MADGDVVLDRSFTVDDEARTRVELFAVESSTSPGGYYYRFQYSDLEEGETLLRYDNAHGHGARPHHRHRGGRVERVSFDGLGAHVSRFLDEVREIATDR